MNIAIIICHRYQTCAGGKCFRAMRNREGGFDRYDENEPLELVGYTTCGGCPGGNAEYSPAEMVKNGAEVIHFATGMIVGYPPCPHIKALKDIIEHKYELPVVIGTHPIPQNYYLNHKELGTWTDPEWDAMVEPTLSDEETRKMYD